MSEAKISVSLTVDEANDVLQRLYAKQDDLRKEIGRLERRYSANEEMIIKLQAAEKELKQSEWDAMFAAEVPAQSPNLAGI